MYLSKVSVQVCTQSSCLFPVASFTIMAGNRTGNKTYPLHCTLQSAQTLRLPICGRTEWEYNTSIKVYVRKYWYMLSACCCGLSVNYFWYM